MELLFIFHPLAIVENGKKKWRNNKVLVPVDLFWESSKST